MSISKETTASKLWSSGMNEQFVKMNEALRAEEHTCCDSCGSRLQDDFCSNRHCVNSRGASGPCEGCQE